MCILDIAAASLVAARSFKITLTTGEDEILTSVSLPVRIARTSRHPLGYRLALPCPPPHSVFDSLAMRLQEVIAQRIADLRPPILMKNRTPGQARRHRYDLVTSMDQWNELYESLWFESAAHGLIVFDVERLPFPHPSERDPEGELQQDVCYILIGTPSLWSVILDMRALVEEQKLHISQWAQVFPTQLKRLLEEDSIIKIGVGIKNDCDRAMRGVVTVRPQLDAGETYKLYRKQWYGDTTIRTGAAWFCKKEFGYSYKPMRRGLDHYINYFDLQPWTTEGWPPGVRPDKRLPKWMWAEDFYQWKREDRKMWRYHLAYLVSDAVTPFLPYLKELEMMVRRWTRPVSFDQACREYAEFLMEDRPPKDWIPAIDRPLDAPSSRRSPTPPSRTWYRGRSPSPEPINLDPDMLDFEPSTDEEIAYKPPPTVSSSRKRRAATPERRSPQEEINSVVRRGRRPPTPPHEDARFPLRWVARRAGAPPQKRPKKPQQHAAYEGNMPVWNAMAVVLDRCCRYCGREGHEKRWID